MDSRSRTLHYPTNMNNFSEKGELTVDMPTFGHKSTKPLPATVMYTSVYNPDVCYAHSAGIIPNYDTKTNRSEKKNPFQKIRRAVSSPLDRPCGSPRANGADLRLRKRGAANEPNGITSVSETSPKRRSSTASSAQTELTPASVRHFAENSTLHGITHVFNKRKGLLRRILWGTSFVLSVVALIFQGLDRYLYYLSKPHVTKLDELDVETLNFPAITICNMNPFRLSAVTSDDFFDLGQSILMLLDKDYQLQDDSFKNRTEYKALQDRLQPIFSQGKDYKYRKRNGTVNMFEFYRRTGSDLRQMVLQCTFQGNSCLAWNDWKEVYTRYGKCYTFNSGDLYLALSTSKGGVDNGLELLLDVQQNEYMPVWAENDEIAIEAGFKVQVHHQSEPPFIHELGFGISPGFQTLVATQEQRITFLPKPWGDCIEKGERPQPFYYKNYSISACRLSCETEWVIERCKCKMVHMIGNETIPYCDPEQYKNCADKALDYLMSQDNKYCNCSTPCEVIRYNLANSMLALPSIKARSYLALKYGVTEEYVRNNFLKLNIFFEALNYETIDQKVAYEVAGLLGDIGGQMGLFIGASILTLLEMFDYIYEVLKARTWGRKPKKNDGRRSKIGALLALFHGKPDAKGKNFENMTSHAVQFSRVPGTVAMTSYPQEQQRSQHFNGGGMLSRQQHGAPLYTQPQRSIINQPRCMPYTSVAYKSSPDYLNDEEEYQPLRQVVEPLPPPPPQYLGRSMMTLGGTSIMHDTHVSKKYDGERRRRETSQSYDDLINMGNTDSIIDVHEPMDYPHHPLNSCTTSGVTTLPHFRANSHGFMPVSANDDYAQNYRYNYPDDGLPHCVSSPKFTYSKTLETDII